VQLSQEIGHFVALFHAVFELVVLDQIDVVTLFAVIVLYRISRA